MDVDRASQELTDECCPGGECGPGLSRRTFLTLSATTVGALAVPAQAAAALGLDPVGLVEIPADKGLTAEAVAALVDRGVPTEYSGAALPRIGMPVGGGCCGQVFLAGDGRLWVWDIFNPSGFPLGGANGGGPNYATPLSANSPNAAQFRQGFALRTTSAGTTRTRTLDAAGFSDVRFTGQYPVGRVSYKASDSPAEVSLEAFSPFIPLATLDSTLPASIMSFTVRNTSTAPVQATLLGFAENPVCLDSRRQQPTKLRAGSFTGGVEFSGFEETVAPRADILFEDWERTTYDGWTATGTAFGSGPVEATAIPDYMKRFGDLNVSGTRFVTSHNYRANPNDISGADGHQGTLTSRTFTVERRFVTAYVGGGNHPGNACLNVLVDGVVVASGTGTDAEPMVARTLDLSAYQGRTAQIQIVDRVAGHWAHVNVDKIVFSDRADVLFEDWERDNYDGWTVTGNAFGSGPVQPELVPANVKRFGDLNVSGTRFVTSYNYRLAGDPDSHTGTLTSTPFRISRRYVAVGLSGGSHPGAACINVLVNGAVVASATGSNSEPLVGQMLDVGGHEGRMAQIQIVDSVNAGWGHINVDAITFTDRADILFEDWERTTYDGWTVSGTAFGAGPVTVAETPEYFRRTEGTRSDLNVSGTRFVTSHNFRANPNDIPGADAHQGTLTSRVFTIDRRYVTVSVGGGRQPGNACVNVLVDGAAVVSATGTNLEGLTAVSLDVSRWAGRSAQIQIVDRIGGEWAHVNVDRIVFSDRPIRRRAIADRPDGGSFALAALDPGAVVRPSIADWSTTAAQFDSPAGPLEVDGGSNGQAGAVSQSISLAPGESRTVRFVYGWFFPTPERGQFDRLVGAASLRHHYATRFSSARSVVEHVAANASRLAGGTRSWVQTWYADSTLPHWFLERTLATASTLSTNTCYRFDNGRFYGFEGTYCCAGTCEHVWNYAQAFGRLFPELERDTRERVDLGIAYLPSGEIGNRGEYGEPSFADGICGTVLRIYREHQMTADTSFLNRVWPRVRGTIEFLVNNRDGADQDGIFEGSQLNTLDAEWFGEIPWISGLYVAALRAGAAMASEVGDTASVSRYTTIADRGSAYISNQLWNGTYGYFIHRVDPARPTFHNSNRGCYIDQMYGQTYAAQLGLPRVFPADKSRTALGQIFVRNFIPDPIAHRPPGVPGGRIYATSGEPGTVMCTWPFGGSAESNGNWGYFNEVWTGQEYQLAAHLLHEGMVDQGLAVTRAVYNRYVATKRNPYNEVECSDHYARALMSFGTYLAACGYEYHGPKGRLGFAPKIGPEDFRAAFTAAEGWGSYRQTRTPGQQTGAVEVRHGQVRLSTLAFETATPTTAVTVRVAGQTRPATFVATGNRVVVTLSTPAVLTTGQTLDLTLTTP